MRKISITLDEQTKKAGYISDNLVIQRCETVGLTR